MMRLLKVELTRLRWRRTVVLLLLAAVVVPAVIWASTAWNTRPVSEADLAAAEQMAAEEAAQPWVEQELRRCERRPQRYGGQGTTADQCAELVLPRAENYLWRQELDVAQVPQDEGTAAVTVLAILLLVVGTTFAGHDWNTGSMSNQLLFEPRRLRVWLAKALAVALTGIVVSAVTLVAFWAATSALAAQRDIAVSGQTWADIASFSLRGVTLVTGAALIGYALTMLFRSTVATLAVAFVVVGAGSLILMAVFGEERAMPLLLPTNALAFLQDGLEYYAWSAGCDGGMGMETDCTGQISLQAGATYLFGMLALAVALSVAFFRRRDLP